MFFTYFFPKLINPRKAATINRDPDPTKTVQFLHMKKAGRDSLRNKMLKINKINILLFCVSGGSNDKKWTRYLRQCFSCAIGSLCQPIFWHNIFREKTTLDLYGKIFFIMKLFYFDKHFVTKLMWLNSSCLPKIEFGI